MRWNVMFISGSIYLLLSTCEKIIRILILRGWFWIDELMATI